MYSKLSDKLLFEYFMMHSTRKNDIYCTVPFYLSEEEFNDFRRSSETLNNLVFRIMTNINTTFKDFKPFIPDFQFKEEILALKRPMSEVFWVRYDGFLRASGGVFYSEFNYDKPCAEREILATGDMDVYNNINSTYRDDFRNSFERIIKSQPYKESYRVALLADPCHYEEAHLMFLFHKELGIKNIEFINVGPKNLYVKEGLVYAFGEQVDIILRLFPTEFSFEITDFENILKVFEAGKVDIVNDPRVIIGQCKNLYTYLWKLVMNKDKRLSDEEIKIIISTLPFTELFNKEKTQYIIKNKNKLVLKPVYGRYSIDVFIGALHTDEEWVQSVNYVLESTKQFIIQEFCEIKPSDTYYTLDGNFVFPVKAFANVGCFMLNHKFSGCCTRWSTDYLTTDDYTWITPIGVKNNAVKINRVFCDEIERKTLWDRVTERSMFEADFTGRHVKNFEYVGLDYLGFDRDKYAELVQATNDLAVIMDKTQNLIYENMNHFADILGIGSLVELVRQRFTEEFLFLGRMDWAVDAKGELKLLEINSETPAGLVEGLFIDKIIAEELKITLPSPNEKLKDKIVTQFKKIINDYSKVKKIETIGLLTSTYYEDWYTVNAINKILKDQPYEFIMGSIYDTRVNESGKLCLYGRELDAVYRYYPLDWFDEEDMLDKKEALKNTLSINPPHTIISQSKAFFAIMHELLKQGYYSKEEAYIIEKYVPKTAFEAGKLQTLDYIVKPILSREGKGVAFACELKEIPDESHIYQERVQTMNLDYWVHSNLGETRDTLYPVFGTYVTGTEFAGMYTRLGKFITENICVYAPVFIE